MIIEQFSAPGKKKIVKLIVDFPLQPSCSIHVNLLYGAVYRVSPSDRLFSSESAPGLVLALGW